MQVKSAGAITTDLPALDSATTPGCDGCGDDCGLRDWRGAGCDGLGYDCGLCNRRADDTDSSDTGWSEWHF